MPGPHTPGSLCLVTRSRAVSLQGWPELEEIPTDPAHSLVATGHFHPLRGFGSSWALKLAGLRLDGCTGISVTQDSFWFLLAGFCSFWGYGQPTLPPEGPRKGVPTLEKKLTERRRVADPASGALSWRMASMSISRV